MRISVFALLALLAPAAAGAQGRIIPRPCPQPVAPPCRDGRCIEIPVVPCQPANPLTRTSSNVRAEMVDRVLRYEVSETFLNRGGRLAEADYIFPLPKGAAFEDLRLSINGELVSGETMNATDARRIYEEIVRKSRDPALVEWMGTGLLRARIFPINPGEEKRVVVRFQTIAEREGDALRVDYVRGTEPNAQIAPLLGEGIARTRTDRDEPRSTFALTYFGSGELGNPYSPTHSLSVNDRNGRRTVNANGEGREVTILLPLRRANEASLSVLAHRVLGEDGYALITITPPSTRGRTTPRDITLVLDVSGSMRGEKMEQAKAAGRVMLESLGREDRFRIIDFSTDVHSFRDEFVPATPANVRDGRRYIDGLRADGSTNISGALEAALDAATRDERLQMVVFLTDGEPTVGERNPDAIAAYAARHRGEARIFSFGVSADVNAALIEQLAVQGHGTAHFVRNGESVERAVSLLAARLTSPVLTNVRVYADGVRLRQMHPVLPQDLFAGQDLVILARYDGSGETRIRVEGRSANGTVTWATREQFPIRDTGNNFIPRLWASQRLGWLAAEKRKNGGTTELDNEIRSLGEKYGIPTEFSSYLVLEPGMQVVGRRVDADRMRANGPQPAPNALSPVVTGAAGAVSRDEAKQLSARMATVSPQEERFEKARQAAAQRNATSLAEVDSISGIQQGASFRQIGPRQFAQQNGVWTDQRYTPTQKTVQVKAYSPLYFELLQKLNGLQDALVLGDQVVVSGRTLAVQVGPVGLERMSERELAELIKAW